VKSGAVIEVENLPGLRFATSGLHITPVISNSCCHNFLFTAALALVYGDQFSLLYIKLVFFNTFPFMKTAFTQRIAFVLL
jgi:hypothetical protein